MVQTVANCPVVNTQWSTEHVDSGKKFLKCNKIVRCTGGKQIWIRGKVSVTIRVRFEVRIRVTHLRCR